ncbi:hypothetical protein C8Q76DRAFT_698539 [Earliella scabrosa]|nr:hypothetical protein C8Q76DRAFT_698539 [Earliella scabrosa]
MSVSIPVTTPVTSIPINVLLDRAAHLLAQSPRIDIPHIVNSITQTCYSTPGFLELPVATQRHITDWLTERVHEAALHVRKESKVQRVQVPGVGEDYWCASDGRVFLCSGSSGGGGGSSASGVHSSVELDDDDNEIPPLVDDQ